MRKKSGNLYVRVIYNGTFESRMSTRVYLIKNFWQGNKVNLSF